jgi:hypothetical protein
MTVEDHPKWKKWSDAYDALQHVPAGLNRDSHRAADERFYRIDSPEG